LIGTPGVHTYDPSIVTSEPITFQVPSKYVKSTRTTSAAVAYAIVSVPLPAWSSVTEVIAIVGAVLSTSIGETTVVFVIVRLFVTIARRLPPAKSRPVVSHRNVPLSAPVVPIRVHPDPRL